MRKRALIFGCTGQDGKYLAELLLQKGYEVHGTKRRSSSYNTERLNHIYQDPHEKNIDFILHYADVTDSTNVLSVIQKVQPDEIYNLAAQSHVKVSFETPEYTANADALGPLRILEAIRILGLQTRFYQASTSEMFGGLSTEPYNEQSPFNPRSPYAAAKLYAHNITVNYREAYGIWACCGILFNHESPYRGETFVTRKITMGIPEVMDGGKIYLGNIDAMRDWGHAQDYMEAAWMMLQQDKPNDYVIATGQTYSVRHFAKLAFEHAGMELEFLQSVSGIVGVIDKKRIVIEIDSKYYRPTEVNYLRGDYSKAYLHLGWKPKHTLIDIVKEMVEYDLQNANRFKDIRSRA